MIINIDYYLNDKMNNEYKIKLIINMFLHVDIIIQGSTRETEHKLFRGNYVGILGEWFWPPHEGTLKLDHSLKGTGRQPLNTSDLQQCSNRLIISKHTHKVWREVLLTLYKAYSERTKGDVTRSHIINVHPNNQYGHMLCVVPLDKAFYLL